MEALLSWNCVYLSLIFSSDVSSRISLKRLNRFAPKKPSDVLCVCMGSDYQMVLLS